MHHLKLPQLPVAAGTEIWNAFMHHKIEVPSS